MGNFERCTSAAVSLIPMESVTQDSRALLMKPQILWSGLFVASLAGGQTHKNYDIP